MVLKFTLSILDCHSYVIPETTPLPDPWVPSELLAIVAGIDPLQIVCALVIPPAVGLAPCTVTLNE